MKIREVHVYQKDLPVKDGPYTMSGQLVHQLDTTIVRLVSQGGVDGWGEVCPVGPLYAPVQASGIRAALGDMGANLIGLPVQPLTVRRALDEVVNGQNYAKAAIDIAVYDLWGKLLGVPVCDLLGGAAATRLPSYFATGIGTPEDISRLAAEKVREGYPRIQIKAGGRPVEEDIATVRKVWEAVDNTAGLAVDANRGLSARDALRLSRECLDVPFTLEQPCNTIEEVAAIRHQVSHAIFLDESMVDLNTVLRVIGDGLVDGFGMKVSRLGGLQPFGTFRDICAARGLPHTCDDSWGGDIVAAACVHMGATVNPKLLEAVWLATPYIDGSYVPENPITVKAGHVFLPDGPGLGIEPDASQFGAPVASFG
ncbi:MAG: mandelate racemase/muconate lactonizing enzyme family protein [Hyphomicrobiales bacterium]|nr:mandelate racemase/muconate lactonizing enzyme family protein [Hyphomicrobiales bacterium]